jgi:hypothetical protein
MTLTQSQAHARAKAKVGKSNQVGSCLAECINPAYNPPLPIPGPWRFEGNGKAWAYNYWLAAVEHGKVVKTSDPMKVPAGALLFHAPRPRATTNGGKAGHVAISAGDGYEFSTDQPHDGHWGKVKIAAVEQAWGKKLVGYIVVTGDGVRLMPDPVPAKPAPAPKPTIEPELWFGIDFRNLAGFNDEGARTFDKRMPALVADIAEVGRPVVAVVELPNPKVAAFSKRMKAIGYKHAAGDLGRHIYVRAGMPTVGPKVFDLKPRLRKDDKQGVAVQITPSTTPALIVTAQLENEDGSGNTQVAQANDLVDQGEAYADKRDIPHSRIIWAVDTNSFNRVRTEVFERRGYVDAFDVAHSAENTEHQSFVPWGGKPVKGDRIDLIAVHKSRPVRRARLRLTPILADHLDMFADIGTTTKK